MTKPKSLTPKPTRPNAALEQRSAAIKRGKGKLLPPKVEAAPAPDRSPEPVAPPLGTVRVSAHAHPGTYGLELDENGLGLHAPPGSSIIVEPVTPTGAGLAVFYMKGDGAPRIFDLTHDFMPEFAVPFAPGSEVVPLIEMIEPITGRFGRARADRIEKIHRVTGIQAPIDVVERHRRAPPPLAEMSECPEGMATQYVQEAAAYPLVRPGETVVYDPARRDPVHGGLCVLQWSNGTRSVLLTNRRQSGGQGEERWWTDPVNRPGSPKMMERRLKQNRPGDMLYTSDGPYEAAHLREKIVGTVVGVIVPGRKALARGRALLALPAPASALPEAEEPASADEPEADAREEDCTVEGAAALDFTATEIDTPVRSPREWIERVAPHAVGWHLGDRLLRMEKAEMVAFVEGLAEKADEAIGAALTAIREAHEEAKGLAAMMEAAEARFFVAASAAVVSSSDKGA